MQTIDDLDTWTNVKNYKKAIEVGGSKNTYQKLANLYRNKLNQPEKAKQLLELYQEKIKS
jgi:hypothetical protein